MKLLSVVILLLFSFNSFALEYFFEPFIGYQFSNQRTDINKDTSILIADETRFETSGPAIGVKMGHFFFQNIALGADFKYARTTGEGQGLTSTQTEIKRKLAEMSLFATATYFDGIFKYWLGFGVYGNYKDSGSYNKDGSQSLKQGKSYKIGIGYYFSQSISINLDLELIETKTVEEGDSNNNYPLGDGTMANALISIGYRFY